MSIINSFKTKKNIKIDGKNYKFYDLNTLESTLGIDLKKIPLTKKILLENLLRNEDNKIITASIIKKFCKNLLDNKEKFEIFFYPTRVLMQDFTGVPAIADLAAMRDALKKRNIDPNLINPLSRVDLIIDHSITVDSYGGPNSFNENVNNEFFRNKERYEFLKWGQHSFDNFHLVPPGSGICHQVNLENISKTIWIKNENNEKIIFPDSVIGTDSHTTMVNSLSVLGWGVGGIEAEAAILGEPITLNFPEVVGFDIKGILKEGVTATDLVLTITEKLRSYGVVGKFVEFYGEGLKNLSLADRATISNMAPEYGATCAFFPTDDETINYLSLTGKSPHHINLIKRYCKLQKLWSNNEYIKYDRKISLNLKEVEPSIAGPKRPQDKILLNKVVDNFLINNKISFTKKDSNKKIINGDIVMAAITSCTNTSNPNVMIAAGLVAKKAVEAGLNTKPWIKTSLAPGSKVVSDYLKASGLNKYLDKIGFNLVGYGCTTCIGNSGPLENYVSNEIKKNNLIVCSILSGNRNFEGRVHPEIKDNYLASPPLVVAYALAGNISIDLTKDPIGKNAEGVEIYLKDLWPSSKEIKRIINKCLDKKLFIKRYKEIYKGDSNWSKIVTNKESNFNWDPTSTYIKSPPFFFEKNNDIEKDIIDARALVLLGDSVTTDHISPAGSIQNDSPAAEYLSERQIIKKDFNSYGSRRGNHEIMIRGTFANPRICNEILPNTKGGFTKNFLNNKKTTVYEAAKEYQKNKIPLIVIAGKEYGTGSSRDWAAKGTKLLGVKAVIAESFERIHRSNLIGMGVIPFEFTDNLNRKSLNLTGDEKFSIIIKNIEKPNMIVECKIVNSSNTKKIKLLCRIDTNKELEYYQAGGILSYVLSNIEQNVA